MLDASAQHAGRTGREMLTLAQRLMGLPANRVPELVHRVGLTENEADSRVGTYSLGMRQRLGLAVALIGAPSVLILDEPANGLDPAGIRWMRALLRAFADEGGTVLLSSHLLHEVEVIADDIVMIGRGRIVSAGSKAELLKGAGTVVRARNTGSLERALRDAGLVTTRTVDGALHTDAEATVVGLVAHESGLALTELRTADGGLEEMFLALTADTQREGKAA
jgi:ABC-2 type transport system ATP-binding protein